MEVTMRSSAVFLGLVIIALVFTASSQSAYANGSFGATQTLKAGHDYERAYGVGKQYAAASREDCQRFLNDTRELRKDLANKRFEYEEAARDRNTTRETLSKIEDQIMDLQEKIQAKNTQRCYW